MSERISLQEPLKVARYYYDLSEKAEWPETPYLRVILHSILRHLESQMNIPARTTSATPDASEEQPATTASPTTAGRSDVLDSPTARMMPLSLRLHCALTEAERTAVVNDLRLSALWDEFTGRLSMHVLAVESATSISQKLASSPSVETSASAAATSSSVSSEIPVFRGQLLGGNRQDEEGEDISSTPSTDRSTGSDLFPDGGPVSHEQALRALGNLTASAFRQRHGATFSIPVRASDDDIVLSRYIEQQRSLPDTSVSVASEAAGEGVPTRPVPVDPHRIAWPQGGFWVTHDHTLPTPPDDRFIRARCATCDAMVTVTLRDSSSATEAGEEKEG